MAKDKNKKLKPKKKCCEKYLKKKGKYCKRCPLVLTPGAAPKN